MTTTITLPRAVVEQALGALDAFSWEQVDAARIALRGALAKPVQAKFDEVAVEQWKLRMVFYDENGEPLMSRQPEPDEILAALAQQAEPQTTHSTECWRWHHKCAVAKIERECKHD